MKKTAQVERGLTSKCSHCTHRNDIIKLTQIAEANNARNLYCENCGKKVGQMN